VTTEYAGRPLAVQNLTRFASWRSDIEILRVSGSSRPNSVAGAIAALLRSASEVEVQAIGPHAVNQAVKAIAIARSYIESEGLGLHTVPSFVKLELHDEERTAVRFLIESFMLAGEERSRNEDPT
jgi:stage V sporulation protein S